MQCTKTCYRTNARGASTALVGSPQTIVDSILDYVDLGCDLISIRGYDNLHDAIDYGRYVLPGVKAALREREARKQTVIPTRPVANVIPAKQVAVTSEAGYGYETEDGRMRSYTDLLN